MLIDKLAPWSPLVLPPRGLTATDRAVVALDKIAAQPSLAADIKAVEAAVAASNPIAAIGNLVTALAPLSEAVDYAKTEVPEALASDKERNRQLGCIVAALQPLECIADELCALRKLAETWGGGRTRGK